jgi:G:T/U-mismatch repair DNA glycosylase
MECFNLRKEWSLEEHPDWYYEVPDMHTLILGNYPPHEKRRHYNFFYPNSQNRFWDILAEIAGVEISERRGPPAVLERQKIMKKLNVGVQNIAKKILRKGLSASDEDIQIQEFRDLLKLINRSKKLRVIHIAGYSSKHSTYKGFVRYLEEAGLIEKGSLPKNPTAGFSFEIQCKRPIRCFVGNSTSGRAVIPPKELVKQFKKSINQGTKMVNKRNE